MSGGCRMAGFANSVRVTIERAPRERVRVPEIRSGGTWADQVRAWATRRTPTYGRDATDHVLDHRQDLEARAAKAGAIPQPRRWRIKSLRLRGSIGIWRGGGGDEIAIDFDDYDAGLVGLVGIEREREDDAPRESDAVADDADADRPTAGPLPPARLACASWCWSTMRSGDMSTAA